MKVWWIINGIWMVLFTVTAILIGVRQVDGDGIVQTMPLKYMSWTVLFVLFVFISCCQLVTLMMIKKAMD
ncbi:MULTISPECIES: DUF3923 family protein [unclassified Companilactobacillus]|uniref:DUF3923 family protein n=1 Tax=unclassified Companilactobacillus TaxID=2767904 RepID=UPI002FEF1792